MEPFNTNIATLIVLTAVIITIAFIIIVAFYIGRALGRQKSEIKQEEDNERRISFWQISFL
jgi:predicted hydrocarbon binding protein